MHPKSFRFVLFIVLALTLGGCHFCADEMNAIFLCVPGLGLLWGWLRGRPAVWRGRHDKPDCVHERPHGGPHFLIKEPLTGEIVGCSTDDEALVVDLGYSIVYSDEARCEACKPQHTTITDLL